MIHAAEKVKPNDGVGGRAFSGGQESASSENMLRSWSHQGQCETWRQKQWRVQRQGFAAGICPALGGGWLEGNTVDEARSRRLPVCDAAHKGVNLTDLGLQPCHGLLANLAFD